LRLPSKADGNGRQDQQILPAKPATTTMSVTAPKPLSSTWPVAGLLLITVVSIALYAAGVIVDTPALTAAASVALLVFGLPHGTFDLALLRKASGAGIVTRWTLGAIALYLACAAAMYLAWRFDPLLALAAFLVMALLHFAEDWDMGGARFLSYGCLLYTSPSPRDRG
jgi:hypothetical protein